MEFDKIRSAEPLSVDTVSALVNEVVPCTRKPGVSDDPCGFPAIPGDSLQSPGIAGGRVDGVGEIVEPKSAGNKGVELMYAVGESIFSAVAPRMTELGWSVFPQEIYDGRKPGSVYGEMISWGRLKDARPDADTLAKWCGHCATLNVACVFGPASGNTFAVDIDVEDDDMSRELSDLADEILGYTPFRREGRAPKIALIYRHAGDDVVATRRRTFEASTDDCKKGIEILGAGSPLTFHGRHHEKGSYFKWLNGAKSPLTMGPDAAPLVTSAQVDAFMSAADTRWKMREAFSGAGGVAVTWGTSDGIRVPKIRADADVQRNSQGLVNDGREDYLRSLVFRTVALGNGDRFHAAKESGPEAIEAFKGDCCAAIVEEFVRSAATDGDWRVGALARQVSGRVNHLVGKMLSGILEVRNGPPVASTAERKATLPNITIRPGEIGAAVDAAEAALIAGGRGVYQRGRKLVGLGQVKVSTGTGEVDGQQIIEKRLYALKEDLAASAVFERWDHKKECGVRCDVPDVLANTLLDRVGHWRLPVLAGFVNAPTLRRDGSILSTPGYDAATGLVFDPQGKTFPAIPENPTREDAGRALGALKGLVATFPFVTESDRAVAMSAFLTAVVRRSLRTAPMHGFSAFTAGSGKSMLADIASILATGREAAVIAQHREEGETEKRLGAIMLAGEPVIAIDNCEHPLDGAFLCQVLTQTIVKTRILQKSEAPDILSNALITATGNNLIYQGDVTRRGLMCRLDPGVDRPELRVFESNPIAEAKARRAELVVASLTILRAYHVAGRPQQRPGPGLGSFEEWSRTVRDALTWLGEADAVDTMEAARAHDPKLEALQSVITQWRMHVGEGRESTRRLIDVATEQDDHRNFKRPDFREALLSIAGDGGAVSGRRLGRWLAQNAGRFVQGYKIDRRPMLDGAPTWSLVPDQAILEQRADAAIKAFRVELTTEARQAFSSQERADLWLRSAHPKLTASPLDHCIDRDTMFECLAALGTPHDKVRLRLTA